MVAAVERLRSLGNDEPAVFGVELHRDSATQAVSNVEARGGTASVVVSDFFRVEHEPRYDAVIGNPPFIRFHSFAGPDRLASQEALARVGIELSGLSSSWAPFVLYSCHFLKDGGRLGMVLPSELLSVDYASDVREYILNNFTAATVVNFDRPIFGGVQTDVVLLLAEGFGGNTAEINVQFADIVDDRITVSTGRPWSPPSRRAKWSAGRLDGSFLATYEAITGMEEVALLSDWGTSSLGVVTGANHFFTISSNDIEHYKIPPEDLIRIAPPVKPAKRGLDYVEDDWVEADSKKSRTWLFAPSHLEDTNSRAYVQMGEDTGVNLGYKCRKRDPWWRVPAGTPGDMMVTYMSADEPRLVGNPLSMLQLNSLHRFTLKKDLQQLGKEVLSLVALSSLTLLGAELLGRAYGGGVLKLELGETSTLPIVGADVVNSARDDLLNMKAEIDELLRSNRSQEAIQRVDSVLLHRHLGLDSHYIRQLQVGHTTLKQERHLRAKKRA